VVHGLLRHLDAPPGQLLKPTELVALHAGALNIGAISES
jgi:hypothetical protein